MRIILVSNRFIYRVIQRDDFSKFEINRIRLFLSVLILSEFEINEIRL